MKTVFWLTGLWSQWAYSHKWSVILAISLWTHSWWSTIPNHPTHTIPYHTLPSLPPTSPTLHTHPISWIHLNFAYTLSQWLIMYKWPLLCVRSANERRNHGPIFYMYIQINKCSEIWPMIFPFRCMKNRLTLLPGSAWSVELISVQYNAAPSSFSWFKVKNDHGPALPAVEASALH